MPHSPARRTAPTLAAAVLLMVLPGLGCRTRPLDLQDPDQVGASDGSIDLTVEADASPPPDLTVPKDNCGHYLIQTTQVIRADLLVVQDKSRSMSWGIDGNRNPPAGQSKWALVSAAIKQVVSKTSSVDWGLWLFGDGGTSCSVRADPNVPVGPGTAAQIRAELDATVLDSGTPTTAALTNARTWLLQRGDKHPHFLLLATDGQPACAQGPNGPPNADDSPAAIRAVQSAAAAGIHTFVVGIGSNNGAEQTLAQMATAGGEPNTTPGQPPYYPVSSTEDLVKILEKAALRVTPCSYPLEHEPPVRDRVTIQGPTGIIPRDVQHDNGWDYSDDGLDVVFYGAACDQLRQGAVASVETIYLCPGDLR